MHCRITIQFEAVNNAFYAWLNGQLLGYSQDSCLPAEFDVTDIVSTEQNILTVQVFANHPSRGHALLLFQGQECPAGENTLNGLPCDIYVAAAGHAIQ